MLKQLQPFLLHFLYQHRKDVLQHRLRCNMPASIRAPAGAPVCIPRNVSIGRSGTPSHTILVRMSGGIADHRSPTTVFVIFILTTVIVIPTRRILILTMCICRSINRHVIVIWIWLPILPVSIRIRIRYDSRPVINRIIFMPIPPLPQCINPWY